MRKKIVPFHQQKSHTLKGRLVNISTWNPKQPFVNGCFSWMIPNLYIENGCFTKHPFYKWLFRVPGRHVFVDDPCQKRVCFLLQAKLKDRETQVEAKT